MMTKINKAKIFQILGTVLLSVVVFLLSFGIYRMTHIRTYEVDTLQSENLKSYTKEEIKTYNGTVPGKQILLGLNGYVYDVTPGEEFYKTGGPYHYLAGRDASRELNLIGGEIIKRKYKIVGRLTQ